MKLRLLVGPVLGWANRDRSNPSNTLLPPSRASVHLGRAHHAGCVTRLTRALSTRQHCQPVLCVCVYSRSTRTVLWLVQKSTRRSLIGRSSFVGIYDFNRLFGLLFGNGTNKPMRRYGYHKYVGGATVGRRRSDRACLRGIQRI